MTNLTGKLAAALALAVIAMPMTAYAQFGGGVPRGGGGGGQAAAPIQRSAPAMRSFTPHAGGRAFTPHVGGRTFTSHTRSGTFTPHVGRSANFSRQHRVTTFNRSGQTLATPAWGRRSRNTATRTLRSTTERANPCPAPQRHRRDHGASSAARPLRLALRGPDGQSFRQCRRPPGLAARPARRLRAVVRAGVLALRLFRHFRLRVLALRL